VHIFRRRRNHAIPVVQMLRQKLIIIPKIVHDVLQVQPLLLGGNKLLAHILDCLIAITNQFVKSIQFIRKLPTELGNVLGERLKEQPAFVEQPPGDRTLNEILANEFNKHHLIGFMQADEVSIILSGDPRKEFIQLHKIRRRRRL
jgi:hypothetical protein